MEAHQAFTFIDAAWTPKGNTGVFCPDNMVKEILNMVKKHANMHPLIPVAKDTFWSSREIYQTCVKDIYQLCHSHGLCKLWGYLWVNWYNQNDWKLFARSAYSVAMPLARTTMITESHWRVLKYNYKYNYNRPRLDRLTQILVEQLVPDFQLKIIHYNSNRVFPAWWEAFKKDWSKLARAEIQPGMDERYHIDVNKWVCSCPAFLNHPYFLCKHLIFKQEKQFWPTFAKTTRRHDHPLLTFGVSEIPTLAPENNPWTRDATVVIEDDPVEDDPMEDNHVETGNSRAAVLENASVTARHEELERRREKLAQYRKLMDSALTLYEREIGNDKFVENFDGLMKPMVKAVGECEMALQAHKQQRTWTKDEKLAFWLQ